MKSLFFAFLILAAGMVQADTSVPSGVSCMKKAKGLGLSIIDSYQACSVSNTVRSCIFEQLSTNKSLGKSAIKNCQK